MQGAIVSARDMIESCMENCQANEEGKNQIMREIDRKTEEMIKRFDDTKRRIGEELDEVVMTDKTRLDDVTLEAKSLNANLQNLVSLTEDVSKHGAGVEKFILNFTCKQKVAWATTKLTELQNNNYIVQHTLEWSDQLLAHRDGELVTLRHAPPPSTTDAAELITLRHASPLSATDAEELVTLRHAPPPSARDAEELVTLRHAPPPSATDTKVG